MNYLAAYAFLACVIVGAVVIGSMCWNAQRRAWNDGVCRESGKPWQRFDSDSHGGIGFTDGCGNYLWLDWFVPVVPKNPPARMVDNATLCKWAGRE